MSAKAYNIGAAVLCTAAAVFTTVALLVSSQTEARNWGIVAGVTGTVGGFAWIVAAIKG